MATSLDLLRWGSKQAARRMRSADRRRRPALERLEDLLLLSTITVINTNPTGAGSLDAAIRAADTANSSTPTTIDFNIPGTGPQTIMVGSGTGSLAGSRFQTIHVPIIFDGWSEGDFQNSTTPGTYQGLPLIVIDGTDVTTSVGAGLDFEGATTLTNPTTPGSSGSMVEGLDLVNWHYVAAQDSGGTAIEIEGGFALGGISPASDITIQGNFIGVGPDGGTIEGNDAYGILDQGNDNTIGGQNGPMRNTIAGNGNHAPSFETGAGVAVYPTSVGGFSGSIPTGNTIQGNYIGVVADGVTAGANNIGVLLEDSNSSTAGGTTSLLGNQISDNAQTGVSIDDDSGDTIEGNIIASNGGGGIVVSDGASDDTIGSSISGDGNTISSNTGNGITVGSGTSDTDTVGIDIEGNSITANTGLGISLGGGTTPIANDSLGHSGPNDFQNYPILSSVTISGTTATVVGKFTELDEAESDLTIDFYADPGDPSGFGEGKVFLGSTPISTDSVTGEADINATVKAPPAGDFVTATATLGENTINTSLTPGDTSEFSPNVAPTTPAATQLVFSTEPPGSVTAGSPFSLTVSAEDSSGDVDTSYDGLVGLVVPFAGATLTSAAPIDAVNGVATFPDLTLSPAGTYTIGANSDGLNPATTTPIVVSAATLPATTTTLASSENPSTYGDTVTFTATVSSSAAGTPTGMVTFFDGQTSIGSAPLVVAGGQDIATFPDSALTGGSHTITAAYSGDDNFASSVTTTPVIQVVNPAPSFIVLTSSQNPLNLDDSLIVGETATFFAEVANGPIAIPAEIVSGATGNSGTIVQPTGTVTFSIDGAAQTPVQLGLGNSISTAMLSDSSLSIGRHTITATYNGDTNYTTSEATSLTVDVQAATSTTLNVAPNPVNAGQTITLSSTVTNTSGSGGTPTGTVDFMTGTTLIGAGTLDASGTVSITTSQPAGTYPIVAFYVGATDLQSSNSPMVTLTVNALPSTTTISSAPTAPTLGQTVTFTAIVSGTTGGPTPTGTVTFLGYSAKLGTAPVTGGQASFTYTLFGVGSLAITADYSGDSTYAPSASAVATLTVPRAASTTVVSSTANPSGLGQAVTFTAVVSDNDTVTPPQGTVTFLDGTTVLGTAPLNFNDVTSVETATFTISTLAAGTHAITASYSADELALASTSGILVQQVVGGAPTVTNLQRFGFHEQPTILVLSFSSPLDAARAQYIGNYTVTGPNATNALTVFYAVTSAVYNPTNNTVTLKFRNRLNVHRNYVIVVNGMAPSGLASPAGVLLDGNHTGQPGSNYETGFGRANLAGPASAAGSGAATIAKAVDVLLAAGILHNKRHHHGSH